MQRKLRSVLFNRNFPPQDRPVGGLNEQKLKYAHETEHISTLAEVVKNVKPTAIIGKILKHFFLPGASHASFAHGNDIEITCIETIGNLSATSHLPASQERFPNSLSAWLPMRYLLIRVCA